MLDDNWRLNEIEKIRENMHKFIFVKRKSVMTKAMELGIDRLGDLNAILDDSMTRERVYEILIKDIAKKPVFQVQFGLSGNYLIVETFLLNMMES